MRQGTSGARRSGRARIQDLAEAVLAGGETEDLLDLIVRTARADLDGTSAALAMSMGTGHWVYEVVLGPDAPELLGAQVPLDSPLGRALDRADADAVEAVDVIETAEGEAPSLRSLVSVVDAGEHGYGFLAVLRPLGEDADGADAETGDGGDDDGAEAESAAAESARAPFGPIDRERLDGLAALAALALRSLSGSGDSELDDERSRIARDLHDLAIQELFAVGMELEGLREELTRSDEPPSSARLRASVATSVTGVENAVAQIRQIVQSLRRERSEATLGERLRHEVGLATAGLGFVPALRLPAHQADLDQRIPAEIAEDVVAVVREGLANAARHAHASAVAVAVSLFREGVDEVVQVDVSDNGRGIDPTVTRRSGLANMSSRARRHQGWVDAYNLEPGTMISWRVTLPPQ